MRFRALITLVAVALVAPTPAQARWPLVERAQEAAQRFWHADAPCPKVWTLKVSRLPSYYSAPSSRWVMVADTFPDCIVYVRLSWYRTRPDWFSFCRSYVHEWGHLLGYSHSEDPHSIMYPGTGYIPKECY